MGRVDRPTEIIRAARPADLDELVRVNAAAFRAGNGPALSPEALVEAGPDAMQRRWQQHFDQPTGHGPRATVIVADLGRILAGFTGGGATRDDDLDASVGELYSLYVDPELWGRGHGSTLHDAALGELVSRGYASAVLWVLEDNAHARGFYLARGWKPEGAQRRFLGASTLRLARALPVGGRSAG